MLNFRGAKETVRCLESLERRSDRPGSVYLADNGSGDDSIEQIERWAKQHGVTYALLGPENEAGAEWLKLIDVNENLGFAAGINTAVGMALRRDESSPLFILNNDTVVEDGALDRLVDALHSQPTTAVVVPRIMDARTGGVWYGGKRVRRFWPGSRPISWAHAALEEGRTARVTFVSGCALLARPEAWTSLGGWDERFFFGVEDLDFSYRMRSLGLRACIEASAVVWHWPGSSAGDGPGRYRIGHKGMTILQRKRFRGPARVVAVAGYVLIAGVLMIVRCALAKDFPRLKAGMAGLGRGLVDDATSESDLHGRFR
jgi:GT2 family glycosyltransferase